MSQPTATEQTKPMTRREAEATLRRLQDNAARRADGLSGQEKDTLADGLNARLGGQAKE